MLAGAERIWTVFFAEKSGSASTDVADLHSLEADGILGGVHAGYNWQHGRTVFGIEGDWDFMDWDDFARAGIDTADARGDLDNLGSVRARIGVTAGHNQSVLLFLNGGVAWADAEGLVCGSDNCVGSDRHNVDFDEVGVVAGGGVEYAVTDHFRLRVDGSYYWFDDTKTRIFDDGSDVKTYRFDFDDVYTFRVGGTFYFTNRPRTVAALK